MRVDANAADVVVMGVLSDSLPDASAVAGASLRSIAFESRNDARVPMEAITNDAAACTERHATREVPGIDGNANAARRP